MKMASNSSSGIRNQPGENLVEFQTLFFCLPPSSKYQCGTSFLAGMGTVVTGCPEMKFAYLKMSLRTPAKTDAPSFEIDTLSIFRIWTWNIWGSSTAFIFGPRRDEVTGEWRR